MKSAATKSTYLNSKGFPIPDQEKENAKFVERIEYSTTGQILSKTLTEIKKDEPATSDQV